MIYILLYSPISEINVSSFISCARPFSVQLIATVICLILGLAGEPKLATVLLAVEEGSLERSAEQEASISLVPLAGSEGKASFLKRSISQLAILVAIVCRFVLRLWM